MRIILTCNFSPWSRYSGGGQKSTHKLATALAQRGHEVTVIFTKSVFEKIKLPDEILYDIKWAPFFGVRSSRSAPLRPLNAVSVLSAVKQLARDGRIDAIHCQGEEGALLPSFCCDRDIPLVITPRYPWYPNELGSAPFWAKLRLWLFHTKYPLIRRLIEHADSVCPTSESSAKRILSLCSIPSERLHVVPNGVDDIFFQSRRESKGETDGFDCLFFGRIEHDKGIDVLIQAMTKIDGVLHIVGEGALKNEMRQLVDRLGLSQKVSWHPWMTAVELADLIAQMSAVILPSRHESFGNAMAETLAVGTTLVSCRTGSIPEVVGEYAYLAEPGSVESLVDEIRKVQHAKPNQARLDSGRQWIRSRYTWDSVAARFESIYMR